MARAGTANSIPQLPSPPPEGVIAALVLALSVAGCAKSTPREATGARRLTVSAAISLESALDELQPLFQKRYLGLTMRYNFGGSGALEQQIKQGAPVDVFIAAAPREMNELEAKGLLESGTRRDLVTNELALVVPSGVNDVQSFSDLTRVKRIAMAEPHSVPAGMYARQVLEHLSLFDRLRPKLVFGGNVRQALAYVESGSADAALVYETEARLSTRVRIAALAPAGSYSPITYPVAIVRGSKSAAASDFVRFLLGSEAQHVFEEHGFHSAADR